MRQNPEITMNTATAEWPWSMNFKSAWTGFGRSGSAQTRVYA